MYITYINGQIRRLCEDVAYARKKLGPRCSRLLLIRMTDMSAANNLAILRTVPGAHCHNLSGDRHGQYSLYLEHPKRLIIRPTDGIDELGVINESLVTEVLVVEIIDYHN